MVNPNLARSGEDQRFPEYIPEHAGVGHRRKSVQRRTLLYWAFLAGSGVACFYAPVLFPSLRNKLPPKQRAAALSLVFPGAGYIACANVLGVVFFLSTLILIPFCLLAWFGAGGLAFPVALWLLSIAGAYYAADPLSGLFEGAGIVAILIWTGIILSFRLSSARARAQAARRRGQRNASLPDEVAAITKNAIPSGPDENRELSLEDLRRVQWLIDVAHQEMDDFSNFNIIDQFQTAALRYQLYEMSYCLSIYQGVYAPNFHGYCSEAIRRCIEKSLTERVMGFWKWETLWGKFKLDFDPIKEDNIMVSGWLILALALYTANTGDRCYTKPGSLPFRVTKNHVYKYDIHKIAQSLVRQWDSNPYTLFSCEPTWIYSPCNLYGWTGQVVYDRVFEANDTKRMQTKFEEALVSEFMEEDGSILPIRNELTGFSIPGLCGALGDLSNAMFCRGHIDHVSRRMWALFRRNNVKISESGDLELINLVGADLIDAGTYKTNPYGLYPMLAHTAGEFGDEHIRTKAIGELEAKIGSNTADTGGLHLNPTKASFNMNSGAVKARLLRHEDWKKLILQGPSKTTLAGPILEKVPYPGVLVALARSLTSKDLKLILYPSGRSGDFEIGVSRLIPETRYADREMKIEFVADATGNGAFSLPVNGRTEVHIVPQEI